MWHTVDEDAIRGMPGHIDARPWRMHFKAYLETVRMTVSAVHIYILKASSVLWFRKHQVHHIRRILHAPNSPMLAFVSKYAMDARIGGWIEPRYLEFEPDAPEDLNTPEELEILTWLNH